MPKAAALVTQGCYGTLLLLMDILGIVRITKYRIRIDLHLRPFDLLNNFSLMPFKIGTCLMGTWLPAENNNRLPRPTSLQQLAHASVAWRPTCSLSYESWHGTTS